mgnify:CR=1 FL=1
MKKWHIIVTIFFRVVWLAAQSPVVSNVTFAQRTDGSLKVDITYDVTAVKEVAISVEASDDGGTTWDLICTSLTGDAGPGIEPGTNKQIIWDFYSDNPLQSGENYKIRITADDNLETGTMTGNDGSVYRTVKIGDQWWTAENLRETKYRNGDDIPEVPDRSSWSDLSTGARSVYDNDESNVDTYGYLYNWYALEDNRNIAPLGWRVPADADWTALVNFLEGKSVAGGKMKEMGTGHWQSPNTGATNESGFSALPGGARDAGGWFLQLYCIAFLWSAEEENSDKAFYRYLSYNLSELTGPVSLFKRMGFSVRFIRDE